MFDLSFASDRVVAITFARFIYLFAAIASILLWLLGAAVLFLIGDGTGETMYRDFGIIHLALGWIGALMAIVVVRGTLEVMIAQIRTSQHTAQLVQASRH